MVVAEPVVEQRQAHDRHGAAARLRIFAGIARRLRQMVQRADANGAEFQFVLTQ